MDILDEILGGLSMKIINGQRVSHTNTWCETKTKLYRTLWSICEGDVHIQIGGEEYVARAGDVILFSQGDVYTAWSEGGCSFVYTLYNIELGLPYHSADGEASGILSGEDVREMCDSFCREYVGCLKDSRRPGIMAYSIFLNYLTNLLGAVRRGERILFQKRDTGVPLSNMQGAISYMSEHFADGISVKEVAEKFSIGEKHFITRFKAITGMPPKQYLTECRMRMAEELLRVRERTVAEVAAALGYADQYSFSKAFKKHYGESPSAFRR